MSDRKDADPFEKFPARPAAAGNVTAEETERTLGAILVDEIDGRSLYAIVGFEGTDLEAKSPAPPWLKSATPSR